MSQFANLSENLIDPDGLLLISDNLLLGRCMNEWLTFVIFFLVFAVPILFQWIVDKPDASFHQWVF